MTDAAWQAFSEARELAYAAILARRATAKPLNAAPYARRSLLLLLRALATSAGVDSQELGDIVAAAESIEDRDHPLGFPVRRELERLDELANRFSSLQGGMTDEEARRMERFLESLPRVLASVRSYLIECGMEPRARRTRRRLVRLVVIGAALCVVIGGLMAAKRLGGSAYEAVAHEGLRGVYFGDQEFSQIVTTRRDAKIDFDWAAKAPVDGVPEDHFGVRWSGNLQIPADDTYSFHLASDDGARLYIDDRLVVDNWGSHSLVESTATLTLKAGVVPVWLEYYDNVGDAMVRLSWSTKTQPKQVIPGEYFVHR